MVRRLIYAATALLLALLSPPVVASDGDASFLREVRQIADATAGRPIGGGASADKVLYLARTGAELRVIGIEALALGAPWGAVPERATAVVRTRASTTGGNTGPEAADLALAQRTGLTVFIVGEWRTPPSLWEIRRQGEAALVREIDPQGAAGPWRR